MDRLNQRDNRPQDCPIAIGEPTAEEQANFKASLPDLLEMEWFWRNHGFTIRPSGFAFCFYR